MYDARFGITRKWDIPLLDGYDSTFVKNVARNPGSNNFWGIINPGLLQQLRAEKFDAVLVYRWSLWSHLRVLGGFGKKLALFFRGDSVLKSTQSGWQRHLQQLLLRWVYRNVDKAFYVGAMNMEYFLHAGLRQDQLVYAPHAVDNSRFMERETEYEAVATAERKRLLIPGDAVVFLYAGKFYDLKNLSLLLQAFRKLKQAHYRLVLYGNGTEAANLQAIAAGDHRIIFEPFKNQSEMPWVYRVGDVFVLPSKSETWGLGVNEAMACKRAAIVSNRCGCVTELIKEGTTGFSFVSDDEIGLVAAMQQFNSREVAHDLGNAAFAHIQMFSLERVAEVIEETMGV